MTSRPDFTPWLCSWPKSNGQAQGFPDRFWRYWCERYRRDPMLHLFCGACGDGETRVDIRPESAANLVGDFRDVGLDRGYASAFADPPYTQEFADHWGGRCPKPSEVLRVMRDAVVPGGLVGVLHLQVVRRIAGLRPVAYHPVFCGTTKHLRCLSVFEVLE